MPEDPVCKEQMDLPHATKTVYEVSSQGRTVYRAILSVNNETAMEHGLYNRQNFEALLARNIETIRTANHIKAENFCWLAAMHKEAGHPHVHILFWDSGEQPRADFIPPEIFEKRMSQIRAAFSGDLNREEIRQLQSEQGESSRSAKITMKALFLDANPGKALSLKKLLTGNRIDDLSNMILGLIRDMPAKGSLRYAYLPPAFKAQVNQFIDTCLTMPELAKEADAYLARSRKISELYSNGESEIETNLEKAKQKLYRTLANEIMSGLKGIRDEIRFDTPQDLAELQSFAETAVQNVVKPSAGYEKLLSLLPRERLPKGYMEQGIESFHTQLNQIMQDTMDDTRIRLRMQHYALHAAGITLSALPDARVVDGKQLDPEEWTQYRKASAQLTEDLKTELLNQLDSQDPDAEKPSQKEAPEDLQVFAATVLHNEYFSTGAQNTDDPERTVATLLRSKRVQAWIQISALDAADVELLDKATVHTFEGKAMNDEQWEAYQQSYKDAKSVLRAEITQQAREDAGWHWEATQTGAGSMLFNMVFSVAQMAGQLAAQEQVQENNQKRRKRDLAKEAKRKKEAPKMEPNQ